MTIIWAQLFKYLNNPNIRGNTATITCNHSPMKLKLTLPLNDLHIFLKGTASRGLEICHTTKTLYLQFDPA